MSTIFSGSAVVLKNLSLPVIIGVNFLKTNSLSPVLEPQAARVVHSTTAECQDLIACVSNRSRTLTKTPRRSFEKSPPPVRKPPPPQDFAIDNEGAPVMLLTSKNFVTIPKRTTQAVEVNVPINPASFINVQPLDENQLDGALPVVYRHKTQQKTDVILVTLNCLPDIECSGQHYKHITIVNKVFRKVFEV